MMATVKMMLTFILMLTAVNCQPQQPAVPDRAMQQNNSRHMRRLMAAYNTNADDNGDDDDARWLLIAVSAVSVTSLITLFALCTCCPQYSKRHFRHNESYIGQIDLEDIRVVRNHAMASGTCSGWSTTNTDSSSGVVMNARALDQKQHVACDCTILNNQRVAAVKQRPDTKAAAADSDNACDAGMSDILLVENGRIVLRYRNVCAAGVSSSAIATTKVHDPAAVHRTGPGHVVGKSDPEMEYDMNDIVWKNMAAFSTKC